MAELNAASFPCVSGPSWPGINYLCTVRAGGLSTGPMASLNLAQHVGDDAATVEENRARLASVLPQPPIWLSQVHGIAVFDADPVWDPSAQAPTADAAITTRSDRTLAIMTADCLPVVIGHDSGQAVAIAHAGWRGLAAGVLERTLRGLRDKVPYRSGWKAWVGPAICAAHFEVGIDVFSTFVEQDADTRPFFQAKGSAAKWLCDLPGIARHRLKRAGVGSVHLSDHCTFADASLFYSYRRDPKTGRMATLAWLSPI